MCVNWQSTIIFFIINGTLIYKMVPRIKSSIFWQTTGMWNIFRLPQRSYDNIHTESPYLYRRQHVIDENETNNGADMERLRTINDAVENNPRIVSNVFTKNINHIKKKLCRLLGNVFSIQYILTGRVSSAITKTACHVKIHTSNIKLLLCLH